MMFFMFPGTLKTIPDYNGGDYENDVDLFLMIFMKPLLILIMMIMMIMLMKMMLFLFQRNFFQRDYSLARVGCC